MRWQYFDLETLPTPEMNPKMLQLIYIFIQNDRHLK
jgi:hypothetical protein